MLNVPRVDPSGGPRNLEGERKGSNGVWGGGCVFGCLMNDLSLALLSLTAQYLHIMIT